MLMVRAWRVTLTVVTAVALAGCAGVSRLDPSPAKPVDFSGSWVLDRASSEDPKPVLDKLRPKALSRRDLPAPDDTQTDESGPPSGGGQQGIPRGRSRRGGQDQPPVVYRNSNEAYTHSTVLKMLLADLARAEQMTIQQSPDRFAIDYGSSVRSFTPGSVSVVSAAWGVADQSSGWKGRDFVIHVKPQTGVPSVERYSLSEDGKHLTEELSLGGGDFPSVQLKRVYDRTDRPLPRAVPTND